MGSISAGAAEGIIKPEVSAVMNVADYATADIDGHWTGFPKATGQSLSYWLQGVRADPLLDHRTTPNLPSSADVVVIGSGVCEVPGIVSFEVG